MQASRAPDPKRVAELFEAALSLPPEQISAFLDQRCGDDTALKRNVLSLLAADQGLGATRATEVSVELEAPRGAGLPAKVGRFAVTRKLGEGGMGVVLEGYDAELRRAVAVKLLRCQGDDESARLRLLREAQALAKITHPNVIPVYEAGVHDGDVFIAMELVPGGTLGQWLAAEPRSWQAIVRLFVDAGRGLAAAHEAGIVHRDFKPDNVLIGSDGRPRVADFGLARAGHGASPPDADHGALDIELTRQGVLMGTPSYMSPEHYEGRGVGPASDQFCFAVALYRALFAQAPFSGANVRELCEAVLRGAPAEPPSSDVPAPVVAAVMRGLARLPGDRFPDMAAMLRALEAPLAENPDLSPATARGVRFVAAGALLSLGLARLVHNYWTRAGQSFTPENIFVQGGVGLLMVLLIGALFRKKLLNTTHNRRVAAVFAMVMLAIFVRRGLALAGDARVLEGLRDEAVGLAALLGFGALVVERWLGINALFLLTFAVAATLEPDLSPLWMGAALNASVAVAVVAWGSGERAARRASREAGRAFTTPSR